MLIAAPAAPPSNIIIVQNGIETVEVSWTGPSTHPSQGYRLTVPAAGIDIIASPPSIIALQNGMIYNLSLQSISRFSSSEVVGPVEFIVKGKASKSTLAIIQWCL